MNNRRQLEQDEAVRLTGEALYRTYWLSAVANSTDWPTQWERLSHPTQAVWDSFAAALATPPPVPAASECKVCEGWGAYCDEHKPVPAAPPALDVERLRLAMDRAINNTDDLDAIVREYVRLSRPSDERVPRKALSRGRTRR